MAAAATALVAVYVLGYVPGALLVDPEDRTLIRWTIIRVISGLLLATPGFLLSLVLSLPWFAGAGVAVGAAVLRQRHRAFLPPRPRLSVSIDGVLAGTLGALILSPS